MLLSWVFDDSVSVAEVKRSRFGRLLCKSALSELIARCGDGVIDRQLLSLVWREPCDQFLLTLDSWGGEERAWQQTSRAGHNLVLQVNMHEGYRRWFESVVPDDEKWLFDNYGHPVLQKSKSGFYRATLGWVRIDLDLWTGEALIEEVQSDWLKDVRTLLSWHSADDGSVNVRMYCELMLARLGKVWAEVLMAAALWFVREELGIRKVWFHTYESGCDLKRIKGARPPRSLYTSLPRKFCYTTTRQPPEFLQRDKSFRRAVRGKPAPQWFHLQL